MPDLISPMTGDGVPEIQSLAYVGFESDFADSRPEERLAIVLVESRLLAPAGSPTPRRVIGACANCSGASSSHVRDDAHLLQALPWQPEQRLAR